MEDKPIGDNASCLRGQIKPCNKDENKINGVKIRSVEKKGVCAWVLKITREQWVWLNYKGLMVTDNRG